MGRGFALLNKDEMDPQSTSTLQDTEGTAGGLSPLSVIIYSLVAFVFLLVFNWAGNMYVSYRYPAGIIRHTDDEAAEKEPLIGEKKRSDSSDEGW